MNDTEDRERSTKSLSFKRNMLSAASGSSIVALGSLFEYGTGFIIAFLAARLLGAEQYGLYGLSLSTAILATTVGSFGLNTAVVRYVAVAASKRDEAGVWRVLQIGIGGALFVSVLIGSGLFVFAQPMATHLFREPQLIPLLRLFGVVVPFMALSTVLVGASRGFKKQQYPLLAVDIAQPFVRLCLLVIFALAGLNAFRAALATGFAMISAAMILLYLLNKEFSFFRPLGVSWAEIREILAYSVPVFVSGLLKKFRGNIQAIFLGVFSTVTSVGIFMLANKVNTFGRIAAFAVMEAAQPVIADLHARGDLKQMGRIYQSTSRWIFVLNFPFVLAIMLLPEPILAIFGESFTSGATVLVILAWANMVNVSTGMSGTVIDMTGYAKLKLVNSIIQIVLFAGFNLLLIPRWGILGAAYASLIVLSIVNCLRQLEVWYLFRLWPYNRTFIKPAIAGLVTVGAALILQHWLPPEASFLLAVTHVMLIFCVYIVSNLLLGLDPEDREVIVALFQRVKPHFARYRAMLGRHLLRGKHKEMPSARKSAS